MTRASLFLLTLFLAPAVASAQKPIFEIGTGLGITTESGGGSCLTRFGEPENCTRIHPMLYASFFASDVVVIEPQIGLSFRSNEGQAETEVYLGGDIGYLLSGPEVNSLLLAGDLGFRSTTAGDDSSRDFAVGGKLGYRVPISNGVAMRLEGGYRRWLDSGLNEFRVGIGIGGIIRGKQ